MLLVWPSRSLASALDAKEPLERQEPPLALQTRSWPRLRTRALGGKATTSTSRNLVIVGIVSGAISILILVGLAIYMIVRHHRRRQHPQPHRHRHSVPATSRIRNGYTRARAESGATDGSRSRSTPNASTLEPKRGYFKSWSKSTKIAYLSLPTGLNASHKQLVLESNEAVYRYDPDAAIGLPKRKRRKGSRSRLALLAPSPKLPIPPRPPLAETTNKPSPPVPQPQPQPEPPRPINRAIRPRAELLMAQPSIDTRMQAIRRQGMRTGTAGLASFVPPPPPSWASFWPTESGFTGFEGEPSIRDEDFDGFDEEWMSDEGHGLEKAKWFEGEE
ncbi:hypothetical protein FRC08_017580, partial [Ceratobasidium sp. 394]